MHDLFMQTSDPDSTKEATEITVNSIDSINAKAELEHIADNSTHLNTNKRNMLLGIINDFEYLFDVTLGEWET